LCCINKYSRYIFIVGHVNLLSNYKYFFLPRIRVRVGVRVRVRVGVRVRGRVIVRVSVRIRVRVRVRIRRWLCNRYFI